MKLKKRKIILIYMLLGIFWVFITDYLISLYFPVEMMIAIQTIKGVIYVLVTALLIYFILRKTEQLTSVKEQEQKLSTLINSMVDFVNFKDGEGRWLETNEFGLKLFQLEGVDYHGKRDSELAEYTDFYRDALIYCEESDEEAWKKGGISRCEEVIPIPDGTLKYFDTIKVPLFNDDGSRKGLVVIGRDITDRKIAEEQLRRKEKLSIVGELAASVGHEIRNPLTSIKGFLQLLSKNDQSNMNFYDIMLKELDRINHIVGELLILAKPQKMVFSKYDIKQLVKDVVSLLETQANMNNIRIQFNDDQEYWIACEQNKLKQLFINIIKNAIEASNENATIWVSIIQLNPEKVLVTIEDEGSGIPEHFLKRIGEPFYSSKEKGTGLGLTVSHKIIDEHNGKIRYSSKEGIGTKVEIELPVQNSKHML